MADRQVTWYMRLGSPSGPTGMAQISGVIRRAKGDRIELPEHVLRLAQAEYEHQYGNGQDYEEMQRRSGLSITEVIALLADLAERHGARPTTPRHAGPSPPQVGPG